MTPTTNRPRDWTASCVDEVADRVYRIPLPLPSDALRAVNVYLIVDDLGLTLVDGGWSIPEARSGLERALASLGHALADVRSVLVTHVHRDHYSLAVSLRQEFGTTVCLGAGEAANLTAFRNRTVASFTVPHLPRHGAPELADELIARARSRTVHTDPALWAAPDVWLGARSAITTGQRTLDVIATPGHTRGHVVYRDDAARHLFAGDHVLPSITPSIGFEPAPPRWPLRDYLDSLRLVRELPDTRLFPAHGAVAESTHHRIEELLAHHSDRLALTEQALADGASTAAEVAQRLPWTRHRRTLAELDPAARGMAVCEAAAHLDVLVLDGVARVLDGAVVQYEATPGR